MLDYQSRFVQEVDSFLKFHLKGRNNLHILDSGCSTIPGQIEALASLDQIESILGINIEEDFPQFKPSNPVAKLLYADSMDTGLTENRFDAVVSANVGEHVQYPHAYFSESYRVLRPGGVAYFSFSPLWTSARGHHIHQDMIDREYPHEESIYRNDGSFIPDWGHLTMLPRAMLNILKAKLPTSMPEYITNLIYEDKHINRIGWAEIQGYFTSVFTDFEISTFTQDNIDMRGRVIPDHWKVAGVRLIGFKN